LEKKFLLLLESLRLRQEFLSLFRSIVLDVWKAQREDHAARRAAAERALADLKRRKDQLVEAFVFQKAIDQATYQQQLDKLNEAMTLAELVRHEERTEEIDLEAVLNFAERVALNAARLWLEASLAQRQRFQALLFLGGLQLKKGEIRTPVSPSFYEDLHAFTTPEERLVSPTGFEPVLLP